MNDKNRLNVPIAPGPDAGFDAVMRDVQDETAAIRSLGGGAGRALTLGERSQVSRVASQGVLAMLQRAGVEEAEILLQDLVKESSTNEFADLISVSSAYYDQSLKAEDDAVRHEKEELSRLARVAGDAAHVAIAASFSTNGNVLPVLYIARQEVIDYDNLEGSLVGDALHAFLDEAEATVPPASPERPPLAA